MLEIFGLVFVQEYLIFTVDQTLGYRSVKYQDAAAVLGDAAFLAQELVGQSSSIFGEFGHHFFQGEVAFEFPLGTIAFGSFTQSGFFFVGHVV